MCSKSRSNLGDLQSSSTLYMAIEKLSPSLRENWWFYVDEQNKDRPDFLMFERWLARMSFVHEGFAFKGNRNDEERRSLKDHQRSIGVNFSAIGTNNSNETSQRCPLADGSHKIWSCQLFKNMSVPDRYNVAKKHKLCFGCLRTNCSIASCQIKECGINGCTKKHNRLLHYEGDADTTINDELQSSVSEKQKQWSSTSVQPKKRCQGNLQLFCK